MKRIIFAALAVIIGFVSLGFSFREWREDRKIDKQGIEATVATPNTYKRIKQRFGDNYKVDLKFKTESGNMVTTSRLVSRGVIDQFESGQIVKLKYLPEDTSMLRVAGDGNKDMWLALAFGLFFLGVGVVMFRAGNNELRRSNT
jgi:protein involved in sex pheromone biosynthesis